MKSAALITARLGSTRLERKHLLRVQGKPMIQFLVDRVNAEFAPEIARGVVQVVIATGNRAGNRELEEQVRGCAVFYGDDDNIPRRHAQAAAHHGIDAIIAVDGDDVMCSRAAMRVVQGKLAAGASYVKTEGLPFGLNAFGYSTAFLTASLEKDTHETLESGWGRIFDAGALQSVKLQCEDLPHLRFSLDYQEDFDLFSRIFEDLGPAYIDISDQGLVKHVLSRGYDGLTRSIAEEYWRNLKKHIEAEESRQG
jgi:spore coat polysaccharide biosynthesis protein SpsF